MINHFKSNKNQFLLFLPFLFFYIAIILIYAKNENTGDEIRYLRYAQNLAHGFYSLPGPYLDLGNGPGYSLFITPFVVFKSPAIYIKLLNALFYYFSIIMLFKSLMQIVPFRFSVTFSIIWALYPNTFEKMPYIFPEIFASSLVPFLIYALLKAFRTKNTKGKTYKYILLSGLFFGYLALTKPIFGYVLMFFIVGTLLLTILNKRSTNYKRCIMVLLIAFATTTPWLIYTYQLTGKVLYWSSYGGNNLYWMSSPFENEFGDYYRYPFDDIDRKYLIPGSEKQIKMNHERDFAQLLENKDAQKLYIKNGILIGSPYTGVIQDSILKSIAVKNIKLHPIKFIQNCFSNAGRIIFNYPSSYTIQKPSTLLRLPVNGTLLVFAAFCLIITLITWKRILYTIKFLLLFALLYFSGSLLGSAEPRMFTVIVPILLLWIAYILNKSVKINLKFKEESEI